MRFTLSGILILTLLGSQAPAQVLSGLDTTSFVVMGEGMAAGMGNFGLSSVLQQYSFPAQMAKQMQTAFEQPLIQPPGIGDVVGYPGQEVQMQRYPQGSVRQFYYPTDTTKAPIETPPIFVFNTSVPALTLHDSITMLPVAPVVQKNMKQTVFNMILGFPQLILSNPVPLWTQLQYAENMAPTMTLVELGYYEALSAAVDGNPAEMPDPQTFANDYNTVVSGLRSTQAQVICTTIPNPIDTAYFSSVTFAASFANTVPFVLTAGYGINAQDYVTRTGLQAMGFNFLNRTLGTLPPGSTLTAATAQAITNQVNALNAQIVSVAKKNGAIVYDMNAFLHKVKASGVPAGSGTVTGNYFGGFYSLDAVYPGPTGNALIANDILALLNSTYHKNFPLVNVSNIASIDPAQHYLRTKPTAIYTPESLGLPISIEKDKGR